MACLFGWEPFIGDSEEPFIGDSIETYECVQPHYQLL